MKPTDLRLGNYIIDPHGEIINIWLLRNDDAYIDWIEKNYKPIPLTEEWLLKFGFDSNYDFLYIKNTIELALQDGFFWYMRTDGSEIEITHVHTLQNLYFALTGEELTIK